METRTAETTRPHVLTLEGRGRARLTGVSAVSCFNEEEVVLETASGEVSLLGENLHIEQLDLDDGQLSVVGSVSAIEYSDLPTPKERRGLFRRKRK